MGEVLILREAEVRTSLDMASCIDAVSDAFAAYSSGRAELTAVIQLDIPGHDGEIHVKGGYVHGGDHYAVKFASGFPGNEALGLAPNDGLVLVFDARTGAPAAFLLDQGFVTDQRTGAAGGAAAILDRFLHRATVVGITGGSYRMRAHRERLAQLTERVATAAVS